MSVILPAALAAFAGVEPEHQRLAAAIAAAEALAAARIGTASLIRRSVSCRIAVPRFRRRLELPEGPLAELTGASLDGNALDPETLAPGPWWIARTGGFAAGWELEVDYLVGWEEGTEPAPPPGLVQALLLIAADQLVRGPDPAAEASRLGDHAVTRRPGPAGLPREAAALLQAWRRP